MRRFRSHWLSVLTALLGVVPATNLLTGGVLFTVVAALAGPPGGLELAATHSPRCRGPSPSSWRLPLRIVGSSALRA